MRSSHLVLAVLLPSSAAAEPDPAPSSRYPRAVIDRPLTLPAGLLVLGGDAGGNHDLSTVTGTPIAGIGITDALELQLPYTFAARDFEARGSLAGDAGYMLVRGVLDGKLEVIARIRGGYDMAGSSALPLMTGVHLQYNVLPWLALISGAPGTEQVRVALDTGAVDVSVPLGIGVQAARTVYAQLDTRLVQIDVHDSEHLVFGRDVTPLALTFVWNVIPSLDVQAAVAADLNDAAEALSFLIGARYYAGKL
jgi:hypothetical protein